MSSFPRKPDRLPRFGDPRFRRAWDKLARSATSMPPINLDGNSLEQTGSGLRVRPGGIGPTELGLVSNEKPAGTVDGMNDTFQILNKPIPSTIRVYLCGVFMTLGEDYEYVADDLIVFKPNQIPQTGDIITVHYQRDM